MTYARELKSISDDELLRRLSRLTQQSRRLDAELIAHIGEVDERRLYAREACSSMFAYCTEVLHLSESEAYLRIAAARASRRHPVLLEMLGDGRLHLSGIAKLVPHLTEANCESVLARATHKSKREIEELVAELCPRPDVPPLIRKLPDRPAPAPPTQLRPDAVKIEMRPPPPQPPPPAVVAPLAPARYKVQFTANAALRDKLQRLQALMRNTVPDGDLATLLEVAVTEKLERLEARRFAETQSPRKGLEQTNPSSSSRRIPAPVKRAVRKRDGGRCAFVNEQGKRCHERGSLEFHHREPFARGGDHSPENIFLVCRAHNTYFAEQDYGKTFMDRYRSSGNRVCENTPLYGTDNQSARPRRVGRVASWPTYYRERAPLMTVRHALMSASKRRT
jgi:HNH endonuclease